MNVEDSIRYWFETLENQGEYIQIHIWCKNRKTLKEEEFVYSHAQVDGIAAINCMMKEKGMEQLDLIPKIPKRHIPGLGTQFLLFLKYLSRLPFWSVPWTLPKTNWKPGRNPEAPSSKSWKMLSLKDSDLIRKQAKKNNVHLNTYLLYCLDQSLSAYYKSLTKKRVWLIPVSLRYEQQKQYDKNITGFVDAYLIQKKSLQKLNDEIKNSLLKGDAFGGHFGVGIGRFIGKTLLGFLVKSNHYMQVRTGVFTNLGSWGEHKEEVDYDWAGLPPVIRSQPVGALTATYHGHMLLAFQFHPVLSRDPQLAQKVIESWIQILIAGPDSKEF